MAVEIRDSRITQNSGRVKEASDETNHLHTIRDHCRDDVSVSWRRADTSLLRSLSLSEYAGDISVNGNDGSATYTYPFVLPPSRGRFQPRLALRYNNKGG